MGLTRRRALLLGLAALPVGYLAWSRILAGDFGGPALNPAQAHAMAQAGGLALIDIRRPDEWALTGIGQGATPLDMRRKDFDDALAARVAGDRTAPIALICARGVRSARLGNRLLAAGFSNIRDVPEGMLGSGAGPGWIARGLPLVTG
ncbi:rhodanese-like domain-containing protein [Fertoeibacter niger]|uniref:rhodanese-like domain-containing protein n=1 Tax=Fertoeibacter niger TaxID=2656921 RepID=UPI0030B9C1EE